MVAIFFFVVAVAIVVFFLYFSFRKPTRQEIPGLDEIRAVSAQWIQFYQQLSTEDKSLFEDRIHRFLKRVRVTGVGIQSEPLDQVFVAAAAIIPIFAFKTWDYRNINEVLLYPGAFSRDFRIEGDGRDTLGMVGSGPMQNVMILSRRDLRDGFMRDGTTSNPAIHEFVHLIDKADGATDGLPAVLMKHRYTLPWLHMINLEIQKIVSGRSDINPYGAKSEAEFLAVAAEYFFMQPEQMQQRHPELFGMLETMFATGMQEMP